MFKTSEKTDLLDLALAHAQGQMEIAKKDKINPFFKSKYADLLSVWDACRGALAKFEISVVQMPIASEDDKVHLLTRISHKGQFIEAISSIPVAKKDPQGYGSAITYLRRYALTAALGIAEEDDDGNMASQSAKPSTNQLKNFAPQAGKITTDQAKVLAELGKKNGWSQSEMNNTVKIFVGCDKWTDIPSVALPKITGEFEKQKGV